jgi:hypothetical protein
MDFDEEKFEKREEFKTKLFQIGFTITGVISVLIGFFTGEQLAAFGLVVSIFGALWAFETRLYQPKEEAWVKFKDKFIIAWVVIILMGVISFPSDPDCYVDWDGRANPTVFD